VISGEEMDRGNRKGGKKEENVELEVVFGRICEKGWRRA
jgi:hypothetical protein